MCFSLTVDVNVSVAFCRKFRDGTWDVVAESLRVEKARAGPRGSAYALGIKHDAPGVFYLAYILPTLTASTHREYFNVTHQGFYFRSKVSPGKHCAFGGALWSSRSVDACEHGGDSAGDPSFERVAMPVFLDTSACKG